MVDIRGGEVVLVFLSFVLVDEIAELEDTLELEGAAVVCEELVLAGAFEDDGTIEVWTVLETEDVLVLLCLFFLCFFVWVDEALELEAALELEGAAVVCEEPVLMCALEDDETVEG